MQELHCLVMSLQSEEGGALSAPPSPSHYGNTALELLINTGFGDGVWESNSVNKDASDKNSLLAAKTRRQALNKMPRISHNTTLILEVSPCYLQNHREVWVRRDLWRPACQTPLPWTPLTRSEPK